MQRRSELFHHVLPHSHHPSSFAKDIHRNGREQTTDVYAAQGDENIFAAVGFQPVGEEEGENEAVEDIYENVSIYSKFDGRKHLLFEKLSVTSASPAYTL